MIKNELPTSIFVPETSTRTFRLAICSPSDMRFAPQILNTINQLAPSVKVQVETEFNRDIANKLRYQEVDFVVDYLHFGESGFCSTEMFNDELVVVANKHHPRLGDAITAKELQNEAHAVLKRNGEMQGYAEVLYRDGRYREAYQGVSLSNILYVVSQSALIAVAPRWMVESGQYRENLKTLPLPSENNRISGYLSWHAPQKKTRVTFGCVINCCQYVETPWCNCHRYVHKASVCWLFYG